MSPELVYMIEKFPELSDGIIELFDNNKAFKNLCAEYFSCTRTLYHWEISKIRDEGYLQEYTTLRMALEQDFLRYVTKESC
jgi:hypothetical protein